MWQRWHATARPFSAGNPEQWDWCARWIGRPPRVRLLLLAVLAVGWCCAAAGLQQLSAAEDRPNFYIFMADDQYLSSVGCYGATPSHTPNIDRLAAQGMKFERCFTPSSICTPNRGAFLSGMVPLKNGAHANHAGFFDGVKSLPNYLRELGYRACLVNKDGIRKPSDLYGWEYRIVEADEPLPGATRPSSLRHRQTRFDELGAFLCSREDRPFCVFHASRLPHTPFLGSLPNGLEGYDASNHTMDQELGRVLDLLDEHDLTDSTIVIYEGIDSERESLRRYGVDVPDSP